MFSHSCLSPCRSYFWHEHLQQEVSADSEEGSAHPLGQEKSAKASVQTSPKSFHIQRLVDPCKNWRYDTCYKFKLKSGGPLMPARVKHGCTGLQQVTENNKAEHYTVWYGSGWGILSLGYSSSPAMRKPRIKLMAFCRSCDVCLPTKLGGGRMRRLAKRVAKAKDYL